MASMEQDWYYLDRSGKEFGPFGTERMRAWFAQGYFPIGDKLLVRAFSWQRHLPVRDLFPDGEPFVGLPQLPPGLAPPSEYFASPAGAAPPPSGLLGPGYAAPPTHALPAPGGYPPPASYGAPPPGPYGHPPHGHPPPGAYGYPPPAHGQPLPFHGLPPPAGYGAPPPYGYPPVPGFPPGQPPWGYPPPHPHVEPGRSRSPARSGRGKKRSRGDGDVNGRPFKPHHVTSVPKSTDLNAKFGDTDVPETTGMLRNIPNKYTQDTLIDEIDSVGFEGTYDFIYLPIDVRNNANVGYAFINFHEPEEFKRFQSTFEGYKFRKGGSKKVTAVSPAIVQGLRQNIENLMKKRVAQGHNGPIVFKDGERTTLEQASKELLVS